MLKENIEYIITVVSDKHILRTQGFREIWYGAGHRNYPGQPINRSVRTKMDSPSWVSWVLPVLWRFHCKSEHISTKFFSGKSWCFRHAESLDCISWSKTRFLVNLWIFPCTNPFTYLQNTPAPFLSILPMVAVTRKSGDVPQSTAHGVHSAQCKVTSRHSKKHNAEDTRRHGNASKGMIPNLRERTPITYLWDKLMFTAGKKCFDWCKVEVPVPSGWSAQIVKANYAHHPKQA